MTKNRSRLAPDGQRISAEGHGSTTQEGGPPRQNLFSAGDRGEKPDSDHSARPRGARVRSPRCSCDTPNEIVPGDACHLPGGDGAGRHGPVSPKHVSAETCFGQKLPDRHRASCPTRTERVHRSAATRSPCSGATRHLRQVSAVFRRGWCRGVARDADGGHEKLPVGGH
jgi:hypothetical protein